MYTNLQSDRIPNVRNPSVHSKSDLVWKKFITFEILSVYMDVESGDSKEGMAEKVQAMRDKAEELRLNYTNLQSDRIPNVKNLNSPKTLSALQVRPCVEKTDYI